MCPLAPTHPGGAHYGFTQGFVHRLLAQARKTGEMR